MFSNIGNLPIGVILLFTSIYFFGAAIWDLLAYKRVQALERNPTNVNRQPVTAELQTSEPMQIAPPSITEHTTVHLDSINNLPKHKVSRNI